MGSYEEKTSRLQELKDDLALARQAMRDIASGKKQSYSVGTRQASAYSMSLADLRDWEKAIKQEINELEADLLRQSRRYRYRFSPRF